jgi:hypothetical protein
MIPARILLTEERPPDVAARAFREMLRAANAAAGRSWHRSALPDHFEPQAHYKYNHKPRSQKWLRRKRRLAAVGRAERGGRVDNVYSGTLERMVRSWAQVRAFPTRATVTMTGPRYVTMKPRSASRPHIAAELTTVTRDESESLAFAAELTLGRELDQYRAPRTREV